MRRLLLFLPRKALLFLIPATLLAVLSVSSACAADNFSIPLRQKTLPNGLTVIVSEDHSAPTFGLCIAYRIGFRLEPEGKTGFAHLFEHMMFEGTPVAPKGTMDHIIEGGGGHLNGDTRWDFTEYIETAPVSALEPVLWLEADRMNALDFSTKNLDNQRQVVEEEVRVNVLNQPYGLFFAIDLPMKAYDTYPDSHNFYGDFHDLDAANIEDVRAFYYKYYAPNNAVLAVAGDVKAEEVFAKVEKYFASVPRRDVPPLLKVVEKEQTAERHAVEEDKLANLPALAVGYRLPDRNSKDAVAGAVTGELLHNGEASLLYQHLVKEKQVAVSVDGGANWPLGNPFEYNGPTLLTTFLVEPEGTPSAKVLAAYDETIRQLATKGPTAEQLARVRTKMRSDLYDQMEQPIDRASLIAHAALFDGNAARINTIPADIDKVTLSDVQAFAQKYLVPSNRTIVERNPAPKPPAPKVGE
ncbi:MAG: pitrilysin family protein [Acidobacteriaceae bacterium]